MVEAFSSSIPLAVQVRGSGYPILCLHGHPGSSGCMDIFTQHLTHTSRSQPYRTITPDLRGYGKSQVKQAFTMQTHVADLEALLDQLAVQTCLILGWSLGGILAMELALRCPERVSGLILIATAAYPRGDHPPITVQDYAYTGLAALVNSIWPGHPWIIQHLGRRSLFRYLIQQHTPSTYCYLAKYAVPAFWHTSSWANRALNQAIHQGYDRRSQLGNIKCPCLMLAGENDQHISPTFSLETCQRLQNCQYQEYPATAHLFPWENPQQVLEDIDGWLNLQKLDIQK